MGWLKDILEENNKVVQGWPAWKRGEAAMADVGDLEQFLKEHSEATIIDEHLVSELRTKIATLEAAPAEKDRASNALREKQGEALRKALEDCNQLAKEKDDLMRQAVQFAEILESIANAYGHTGIETNAFLTSPEVQAYRAQQKEGE